MDDVILNPGTGGDTIAADDIGGIKYQRIKLTIGGDGSNEGDVSGTNPIPIKLKSSSTSVSSVDITNANTNILASNANRLGAVIYNEGTVNVYVKLGTTASSSSYSVQIRPNGYYEMPFGYTGNIDGITDGTTATVKVTELT